MTTHVHDRIIVEWRSRPRAREGDVLEVIRADYGTSYRSAGTMATSTSTRRWAAPELSRDESREDREDREDQEDREDGPAATVTAGKGRNNLGRSSGGSEIRHTADAEGSRH